MNHLSHDKNTFLFLYFTFVGALFGYYPSIGLQLLWPAFDISKESSSKFTQVR
jgi:hypothetical protein